MSSMSISSFALSFVVTLALSSGAARAGELDAKLAAERTHLLAGSKTQVGAVLTLEAPDAPEGTDPASVGISLVIDRSGSMSAAGKITMVHVAGGDLVDRLESCDEMGIVAYASNVEIVRPLSGLTEPEGVKRLIRQLTPTGNTNLGGGLQTGIGLFKGGADDASVRRLLLLTDGLANKGETRPEVLARWAREAFTGEGTRVSTVGLGLNYNEKLLTKIAHAGGGEFYYVSDRSQLPDLFRRELEEGRTVVVKGLDSTWSVSEGARLLEMVGYPFADKDENVRPSRASGSFSTSNDRVKIGDFFAKEKRSLLLRFELEPPEEAGRGTWRAAAADLTWTDAAGAARTKTLPLEFEVTESEAEVADGVNSEVRVRVIENENYRALDRAMDQCRKGNRKKALQIIKQAEERISNDDSVAGDKDINEQAAQLAQARREIEQGEDRNSVAKFNTMQSGFGYRSKKAWLMRQQVVRVGGSDESVSAVADVFTWLTGNQSPEGFWDPATDGGRAEDRQYATSLAVLSFLAAGHTERWGAHSAHVSRAIQWLISRKQPDGRIGEMGPRREPLARFRAAYHHAIATLALGEAAGMGRVPETKAAAQGAVDWLVKSKPFDRLDRTLAGSAGVTGDDVAGVAWCALALKSAMVAGLNVPVQALKEADSFLGACDLKEAGAVTGRFSFSGGRRPRRFDTMVGLLSRMCVGYRRGTLLPTIEWAISQPKGFPLWGEDGGEFDWYYAYFGNLVCFQTGGDVWKTWNGVLRDMLVDKQITADGDMQNSWDPVGTFAGRGRVMTTALAALCLEVYYRYLPIYR